MSRSIRVEWSGQSVQFDISDALETKLARKRGLRVSELTDEHIESFLLETFKAAVRAAPERA